MNIIRGNYIRVIGEVMRGNNKKVRRVWVSIVAILAVACPSVACASEYGQDTGAMGIMTGLVVFVRVAALGIIAAILWKRSSYEK